MSTEFEISCTGCAFCSDRCPMDIPIAEYFALYNEVLKDSSVRTEVVEKYETHFASANKASDCLRCGQCEGFCPEHLPITSFLQDIAEEFEDY